MKFPHFVLPGILYKVNAKVGNILYGVHLIQVELLSSIHIRDTSLEHDIAYKFYHICTLLNEIIIIETKEQPENGNKRQNKEYIKESFNLKIEQKMHY